MKVAVPSMAPGGLEAQTSAHFGHCDAFTILEYDNGQIGAVEVLFNQGHVQGGCMAPVMTLKNAGVDVLLSGGMGARPLMGFQQVGIEVYFMGGAPTVNLAVELLTSGAAPKFGPAQVCGGGEGGCGGHDH